MAISPSSARTSPQQPSPRSLLPQAAQRRSGSSAYHAKFCFAQKATSLALHEIPPLLPSSPHSVTRQGVGIFVEWFGANWFNLLQTVAIVAGLFFTGRSFLVDTRIRRISNLLNITEHHRSIWQQVIDKPNLLRVLNAEAKLDIKPITLEERIFVNLIILHLTAVMAAIRGRVHEQPAGQDEDLREFFSLPIPNKVWKDSKRFREPDVIAYIESLLKPKPKKRRRKLRWWFR